MNPGMKISQGKSYPPAALARNSQWIGGESGVLTSAERPVW